MTDIIGKIAGELGIKQQQVKSAVELIDEGNTIPFISRYRKEATGGLSDDILRELEKRLVAQRKLEERKTEVLRLIEEAGSLTPEISKSIQSAVSLTEIDDIYRPFRPKRRTRASVAMEKGLGALADMIIEQKASDEEILRRAEEFVDAEKGVESAEEAIAGAKDIAAEVFSDNAELRGRLRRWIMLNGEISSKALTDKSTVYDTYYDFSVLVKNIKPHQTMALRRGEKEKILSVKTEADEDGAMDILLRTVSKTRQPGALFMQSALDSYKRLVFPSIEREIRNIIAEDADEQAIKLFAENLKNLLLQPPLKGKTVLALDPGFRTGNKAAVVDATGKVLDTGVVYMTLKNHDIEKANKQLSALIEKHGVEIIAIGNGTAGRETELAVAALIKKLGRNISYVIVNEAGASVYSASKLGSDEFPDFDVALRSAVSIARRLQDPLAELVKIEPNAIGVGQYQHDVNQKQLSQSLDGVVEYCVNEVGVDLNTASAPLLKQVSGISGTVAENIVKYRENRGRFVCRSGLLSVPKLGSKAFEQCAGFLRILDGENILDNTAIHPESYPAVNKLLKLSGYKKADKESIAKLRSSLDNLDKAKTAADIGVGEMTLKDIIAELKKPGRDPRESLDGPELRVDVLSMEDLKEGMLLTGTVRNVIDFGAFVDIGVHQDGLVHISQLSDSYVKHPMNIVSVGDIVKVKVLNVDLEKKRISLSMKNTD